MAAVGTAVLLTLAAVTRDSWHPWLRAVEGAAAVYAALFVLAFVSPRSFGFGDVRLGGVLGAYLGWFGWAHVYYGIFAGFVLGAVLSSACSPPAAPASRPPSRSGRCSSSDPCWCSPSTSCRPCADRPPGGP